MTRKAISGFEGSTPWPGSSRSILPELGRSIWAEGYKLRWRIEDFHLVLKSGCHAGKTQLKTAERITKLVGFLAPVAIRILQLRDKARTEPDAPCTVITEYCVLMITLSTNSKLARLRLCLTHVARESAEVGGSHV